MSPDKKTVCVLVYIALQLNQLYGMNWIFF